MNKRARLTRRILREHRRGTAVRNHMTRVYRSAGGLEIWDFWACPHCQPGITGLIPMEVPHAYR